MAIERLSKILFVIATALIFFRTGPLYFWPFELLSNLAILITFVAIFLSPDWRERARPIAFWVILCAAWFIFILLGDLNNHFLYGRRNNEFKNIFLESYQILAAFGGFLIVLYYGRNLNFRRWILRALNAPILLVAFIFLPDLTKKFHLISANDTFEGFAAGSATIFASMLILPMIALFTGLSRKNISFCKKAIYWILMTLGFALTLWTGVRAAWLALFLSALFIFFISILNRPAGKIIFTLGFISALGFSLIIGFNLLPHPVQLITISRVFPQIASTENPEVKNIILEKNPNQPIDISRIDPSWKEISITQAAHIILRNPQLSIPYQSRDIIWPRAYKLFLRNPFGLGMGYYSVSKSIMQDGIPTKAHNYFLEAGLTGGIGTLLLATYLLIAAIKAMKKGNWHDPEWTIVTTMFWGSFIISFFNGQLFYTGWITLGLLLSLSDKNQENAEENQSAADNFENIHALPQKN